MAKVPIVEDDEVIGQAMAAHLARSGCELLLVAKGELGLARLRYERPHVDQVCGRCGAAGRFLPRCPMCGERVWSWYPARGSGEREPDGVGRAADDHSRKSHLEAGG